MNPSDALREALEELIAKHKRTMDTETNDPALRYMAAGAFEALRELKRMIANEAALATPVSAPNAATQRMAKIMGCDFVLNETSVSVADVIEGEVERVARALAVADGKDPDAPAWVKGYGPNAETFGICWRDQYSDKAEAAIAALRSQVVGVS